jgi:hypothetical protein
LSLYCRRQCQADRLGSKQWEEIMSKVAVVIVKAVVGASLALGF